MIERTSHQLLTDLIAYSLKGQPCSSGYSLSRFTMYKTLEGSFKDQDSGTKRCLAVSKSVPFGRILGLEEAAMVSSDFPECNLVDLDFADESFDFLISDQVLEHLEGDPFTAFKETARVLKPGGLFCHTTCFINQRHDAPADFWRFTPKALALLTTTSGCEVVLHGGWGNPQVWTVFDAGFRSAKVPDDVNHPLHKIAVANHPKWPIVTWVIGKKPLGHLT